MPAETRQPKTNLRLVRARNTKLVLQTIRNAGEISRHELARRTRLSPTTVAKLVDDLIAARFVREVGKGASSGGRQPVLLALDRSHHHFLALRIWQKGVEWSLLDFGFEVVQSRQVDLPRALSRREFTRLISANLDICSGRSLLGVAVSVAGVVQRKEGRIWRVAVLSERGFPLVERLERALGAPVIMENVEAIKAWAASVALPAARTVICFEADLGVGAGLVIDGRLYRGRSGAAGEIGHTIVRPGGPRCSLGHRGCLEALTNLTGFNREFRHALGRTPKPQEWDELVAASPACKRIVEEKAELMATALCCLADAIDPDAILLTGRVFTECECVFKRVERYIVSRAFVRRRGRPLPIRRWVQTPQQTAAAAARLLWHEVYASSDDWPCGTLATCS